jgi:hypothetical protein
MARPVARRSRAAALPDWIPPQLTQVVDASPEGDGWLHEIKFDGYRLHAWLDLVRGRQSPAPETVAAGRPHQAHALITAAGEKTDDTDLFLVVPRMIA